MGIGEREEAQFFYYFVESQGNPEEDPLIFYLTGGPGCSAVITFFYQIGKPFASLYWPKHYLKHLAIQFFTTSDILKCLRDARNNKLRDGRMVSRVLCHSVNANFVK